MSIFTQNNKQTKEKVELRDCPICKSFCQQTYFMEDAVTKKKSKWLACSCGVIFQKDLPKNEYGAEYLKEHADGGEKYKQTAQYPIKIYAPIIEELIYGRRALVIGTPTFHQVDALKERGWVVHSIDKNKSIPPSNRHIVADFETYQFQGIEIDAYDGEKVMKYPQFNLIWIYSTLECFIDPVSSLKKCFTLMPEDGVILIVTPDTDFVYTRSSSAFNNWNRDRHNIMWNKRSLTTCLETLGYQTLMVRRNHFHRFPELDGLHVLAQKKFF